MMTAESLIENNIGGYWAVSIGRIDTNPTSQDMGGGIWDVSVGCGMWDKGRGMWDLVGRC